MVNFPLANSYTHQRTDRKKERNINNAKSH